MTAARASARYVLVGRTSVSIKQAAPLLALIAIGGDRVQNHGHHVQANLPAARTTTHTMRNRNIETAKSACFLNSLKLSLIRVVRRKKTERTKRKIGMTAARKAMILKIIVAVTAV